MQKISELRNKIIEIAKHELDNNPASIQVTIFETTSGEIIPFFLYDLKSTEAEDYFINELIKNKKTKINLMLTMWNNKTMDMPKRSLLLKVYELDDYNANTCVLLFGENGIGGFRLSNLL